MSETLVSVSAAVVPPSSPETRSKVAWTGIQPSRASAPSKSQIVGGSSAPKGPWRTARSSAAASTARDIDPHATRTVMLAIATVPRTH